MSTPHILTARWIFPVVSPPLFNGTITIRGETIEAVSTRGERTVDEDLGNVAVIPGLVNAHTHLDLSGARGLIPPTDRHHFTDWLQGVIAYRRGLSPQNIQADIRAGLAECLRHGTTLIGDIASNGDSWEALAASDTRALVFREIIGLTPEGFDRWNEATAWLRERPLLTDCRPGYAPHAPYSVNADVLVQSLECGKPVSIHLAESLAEIELLESRGGPFVEFLRGLAIWDSAVLAQSLSWLLRMISCSNPRAPLLLAHGNYLPTGTQLPAHASIAYCPRTHATFQHPPHPFRELLCRGLRVCLGTDSLASNPDLDVLAEARFLRRVEPDFPADQLLRMATLAGAQALGFADVCGSLEAGKSADLVAVPLADREADPHELLMEDHSGPRRTMFRGRWRAPVESIAANAEPPAQ